MKHPRIVNVQIPEYDDEDTSVTHEIDAADIEVPDDVCIAVHRSGLCDYNTAKNLNLTTLFDLLAP